MRTRLIEREAPARELNPGPTRRCLAIAAYRADP